MSQEVVEVTPLVSRPSVEKPPDSLVYKLLRNLTLIALWSKNDDGWETEFWVFRYFFSTTLSLLNKHLIGRDGMSGKGKFPAPLMMVGVQFFVQFVLARLFLDVGLVQRLEKHEDIQTWGFYFKNVVPNGVSTGLDIGFSNLSLKTISLSFYTMCKSTTPIFLLIFAFIWKLESPSWSLGGIVMVIMTGIVLLVYGETKFSIIGFSLVMVASCLAGFRWTLTQILLQGNKRANIMSGVVLIVSVCVERWHRLHENPYFASSEACFYTFFMITSLGLIAFLMVWTEFKVIKETSALTFMVAGTCKEVVTVFAAVMFLHEDFGVINSVGLLVLIAGVSLFNLHKYKKMKERKLIKQQHPSRHHQELVPIKSDLDKSARP